MHIAPGFIEFFSHNFFEYSKYLHSLNFIFVFLPLEITAFIGLFNPTKFKDKIESAPQMKIHNAYFINNGKRESDVCGESHSVNLITSYSID